MEQQLNHAIAQWSQYSYKEATDHRIQGGYRFPRTLEEALEKECTHATVVTGVNEPFEIVAVNAAWEQLCEYTQEECVGKTLGILQGPETNQAAITALLSQLLRGEEAGTVLVNYTKSGRKFYNRLEVGPLMGRQTVKRSIKNKNRDFDMIARDVVEEEQDVITHFVGVLTEVSYSPSQRIMM